MESTESLGPGFCPDEAKTLASICQKTYERFPCESADHGPVVPPPPTNWQIRSDLTPTSATPLDNYWEVWQNTKQTHQYAIAVRGTAGSASRVYTDLIFPLIKARLSVPLPPNGLLRSFKFNLARRQPDDLQVAGVHAGFASSLMLMLGTTDCPLLVSLGRLAALNFASNDKLELFVTGHGQGGSIALLLTSFIRHSKLFSAIKTKTYAFAPGKPGNDRYSCDLDEIASVKGLCYSVCNTQDWVPQLPLTMQTLKTVNAPNNVFGDQDSDEKAFVESVDQLLATDNQAVPRVSKKINDLTEKLGETLSNQSLTASNADYDPIVIESGYSKLLETISANVLGSLNYSKAGSLAPLFADASTNPDDPDDVLWQHCLGNYYKSLT
jgi:hypothetical protein